MATPLLAWRPFCILAPQKPSNHIYLNHIPGCTNSIQSTSYMKSAAKETQSPFLQNPGLNILSALEPLTDRCYCLQTRKHWGGREEPAL